VSILVDEFVKKKAEKQKASALANADAKLSQPRRGFLTGLQANELGHYS
jgi:hypothetical protein